MKMCRNADGLEALGLNKVLYRSCNVAMLVLFNKKMKDTLL